MKKGDRETGLRFGDPPERSDGSYKQDRLTRYAQVRSYLKATGLHVALLVNFAGAVADYRRVERKPNLRDTAGRLDSRQELGGTA